MISILSLRPLLYISLSIGVKPRHGGHQCAEKYKPMGFPAASRSKSLPMASRTELFISMGERGFHGYLSPAGSFEMTSTPSLVIVAPSVPTITREGMPLTLYFFVNA